MKDFRPSGYFWLLSKMGGIPPAVRSVFPSQHAQHMAFIRQMMKEQRRELIMNKPLSELEVVVFDLETTGFFPEGGDEILSIGAVAVKGNDILEEERFYTLIRPGRFIPANIVALTGISEEDVKEAPGVAEGLRHFFAFVGRRMLVAHASNHDKQFLNAALWRTSKVRLTHRVLDTMIIAKWLEPKREDYSLDALLRDHGIPLLHRHHALDDSIMTARLWVSFLQKIRDRRIDTVGDLYACLSRSV